MDAAAPTRYPGAMLSQKARYALRALLHLVEYGGDKPVQAGDIAEAQSVPRKFLEAILADLTRAGLIASRRGRSGGYLLARAPETISFAEIIRGIDGPLALVPCASQNFYARCGDCHDEATCAIRRVMMLVRDEAVRILDGTSLADAATAELAGLPMPLALP